MCLQLHQKVGKCFTACGSQQTRKVGAVNHKTMPPTQAVTSRKQPIWPCSACWTVTGMVWQQEHSAQPVTHAK